MLGNVSVHSLRNSLSHTLLTGSCRDPASLNKFKIAIAHCVGTSGRNGDRRR